MPTSRVVRFFRSIRHFLSIRRSGVARISANELHEAIREVLASHQGQALLAQCLADPVLAASASAVDADPPAADVSAGEFGANTGGGDYTFPSKVGIGVSSPDTNLVVKGDGSGAARLGGGTGCGGNYTALSLNGQALSGCANYNLLSSPSDLTLYINRPSNNSIAFRHGNVSQMELTAEGKLGIGTTAPVVKLHAVGAAGDDYQLRVEAAAGRAAGIQLTEGAALWGGIAAGSTVISIYNGSLQASQAIHIAQNTGNVGIGTTTPAARLECVSGQSSVPAAALSIPNVADAPWLRLAVAGGTVMELTNYQGQRFKSYLNGNDFRFTLNNGNFVVENSATSAELMRVSADGNMDVAGPVRFGGYNKAGLPAPGAAGRLVRVTDASRGVWMDTGAQWFSLGAEIFNVKEFGAKGNGSNDDTDAIQAAIDAARDAGGGIVVLPPGAAPTPPETAPKPYLTRKLTSYSNIVLQGAGAGGVAADGTVLPGATTLCFIGSSGPMLEFGSARNFSIRNIQFDYNNVLGNPGPGYDKTPAAVFVDPGSFFEISDCSFVNLSPSNHNGGHPSAFGICIQGGSHDFKVERNYTKLPNPYGDSQNNAILVTATAPGGVNGIINANHCDGSNVQVVGHDLRITNNVVHGFMYGSGITVSGVPEPPFPPPPPLLHDSWNIEIIGNTVYEGMGKDKDETWCAGIENWARDSIISANICHDNAGNGIGNGGYRCIVTDNTCYDNGKGANGVNHDHYGITIFYHTATGQQPYNASRSVYSGNVCFDTHDQNGKTQWYGIGDETGPASDTGFCHDVRIGANNLFENKSEDLRLRGSNYQVEVASTSGAADFPSLKIGGEEVITSGRVLQNVVFNPSSLQIGGQEVISSSRELHDVTADAGIITGIMDAAHLPLAGSSAAGIVSTSAQILAGDKTFSGAVDVGDLWMRGSHIIAYVEGTPAQRNIDNVTHVTAAGTVLTTGHFDAGSGSDGYYAGGQQIVTAGRVLKNVTLDPSISLPAGQVTGTLDNSRLPATISQTTITASGNLSGGSIYIGTTQIVNGSRSIGNVVNIVNSGYIHTGGVGNFDAGVEVDSGTVITSLRQMIHRYIASASFPTLAANEIAIWYKQSGDGGIWLAANVGGAGSYAVQMTQF